MKVLVIGGNGMAGHMIKSYLMKYSAHEVWYTLRGPATEANALRLDVTHPSETKTILSHLQPDVVINAVGILNDQAEKNIQEAICVNSLFPHQLAEYGDRMGFRLIHISTDCVFSGEKGEYTEKDPKDGLTVYAKTKSLGEVDYASHLTVRTSIIGPELKRNGTGLLHWFLQQKGAIYGYRQVYWNGVTTLELAKVVNGLLPGKLNGLVHLASPVKISKYDLLLLFQEVFERDDVKILPSDRIRSDKSLQNTRSDFHCPIPTYKDMMIELKEWMAGLDDEIYGRKETC